MGKEMRANLNFLLGYLLVLNILTFVVYGLDKRSARPGGKARGARPPHERPSTSSSAFRWGSGSDSASLRRWTELTVPAPRWFGGRGHSRCLVLCSEKGEI